MELRVGDTVDVPGGMYGSVKFVGEVAGKNGKFAGVQLAAEFAIRGKNSGDVDGKHYFRTTQPGSGIFLPVEKAVRRGPATPMTPSLMNFSQSGRTPTLPKPNFSQSVGPGARAASPALKPSLRRPSLQRPVSPLRQTPAKPATKLSTPGSRPSLGPGARSVVGIGSRYGQSPMSRPSNLAASLRGAPNTPSKTPLGPEPSFDEESDSTPTPTPVPAKTIDDTIKSGEVRRLKESLDEKDRQLKEQASTLSDMEKSLSELQSLLPPDSGSSNNRRDGPDGRVEFAHVAQMRSIVREKNEKIQMLIAEFDAHRADFRSTIDTLELASTETERVYEKRVDELLQEIRELQDRGEDVETVAQQLKQLEELVQELEEGLEDARRGEAEARGEVEYLRGEVERGRLELKREKSQAAAAREDSREDGSNDELIRNLEAKEDEIRGLKAIIHSLSENSAVSTSAKMNGHVNGFGRNVEHDQEANSQRLEELEALIEQSSSREIELERELERLQSSDSGAEKHKKSNTVESHRLSDRTVLPGDWRDQNDAPRPPRLDSMPEADARSTVTDSSALWCEICETGGHDILTCTNMFAVQKHEPQQQQQQQAQDSQATSTSNTLQPTSDEAVVEPSSPSALQRQSQDGEENSADPHEPRTSPTSFTSGPPTAGVSQVQNQVPAAPPPPPPPKQQPSAMDPGMVAGKSSGIIDSDKWCALCERDGHESVDCPFEDAF